MKADRNGNMIGNGYFHTSYSVIEHEGVSHEINKSQTTETVYVKYYSEHGSITVRFSNHENNAVKFGDQLDGNTVTKMELLAHLGLMKRTFIPHVSKSVPTTQIKMKKVKDYEQADLTIQEMYELPVGTDLSKYVGKVAKSSNYRIDGNKITEIFSYRSDMFGQKVKIGEYKYELI